MVHLPGDFRGNFLGELLGDLLGHLLGHFWVISGIGTRSRIYRRENSKNVLRKPAKPNI